MKKIRIMLVILLIMAIFAGCGNNDAAPTPSADTKVSSEATPTPVPTAIVVTSPTQSEASLLGIMKEYEYKNMKFEHNEGYDMIAGDTISIAYEGAKACALMTSVDVSSVVESMGKPALIDLAIVEYLKSFEVKTASTGNTAEVIGGKEAKQTVCEVVTNDYLYNMTLHVFIDDSGICYYVSYLYDCEDAEFASDDYTVDFQRMIDSISFE